MSEHASQRGGARSALPPDSQTETLGVAFFDLSRKSEWASSEQDERVAAFLNAFYTLAGEHLTPAGGRIVKFMGDAGLVTFAKDSAEACIFALCDLALAARELALDTGFDSYLNINVHVGPVVTGTFGPPGLERYDVIGKAVNVAARLGRRGVTLSAQAFRCLSPQGRERFDKHTPAVTYRFRF